MEHSGIVAYRDELERVVDRYEDFLGDEAASLAQEHGVPSAKELQASLAAIEGENRLLKIGVVGRVKSGKSSLLNALLFKGESILPKAATPMTAALTTLSYGESLAAEVEFFTQEDLRHIRDKYREYKTREERLYEKFLTEERAKEIRSRRSPEERASSRAKRAMREGNDALIAAYDQYDKIEKSMLNIGTLEEKTVLQWARLADLQHQLDDYVGATGRYMPVTKSVNIRLPQENLRDIEIVDTPGINDPVRSREERTQQHLRQCDVVLIVSPAGQFMTTVDLNLMDRITGKEGIRELYVVASQADMQLYGNLQDESNGNLDRALDRLTTEVLGSHLEQVIDRLKERNPEVGDTYDPLLEQGKIIHTAGICESLKQRFEQKDAWDEGMQHVWDTLLAEYQNYFSAENAELSRISLDKLSNISRIREIVAAVREQKDAIIKTRQTEYSAAKLQSLHELKNGLLKYANERHTQIEHMEIESFKKRRDSLFKSLEKTAFLIRFIEGYDRLLPERIEPATAIPSFVMANSEMAIKGFSRSGDTVDIDPALYSQLSHNFIDTFSFNLKHIMPSITVEVPLRDNLFANICLIDTPGYNPGGRSDDRTTAADFLKDRDALIWMIGLDATGTVPEEDLEFLEELELGSLPLYVVLNKADIKPHGELEAILDEVKNALADADIEPCGISVYSSRRREEFCYDEQSSPILRAKGKTAKLLRRYGAD